MSGVIAIRALLVANADVIARCPATKIIAGTIPLNTVLPAISIAHISTMPTGAIDAYSSSSLVISRIQVTAMDQDYPSVQLLLGTVRKACNYQRGTLNGVNVVSILRDITGPDMANDGASIHYQSIDFKVTFYETN